MGIWKDFLDYFSMGRQLSGKTFGLGNCPLFLSGKYWIYKGIGCSPGAALVLQSTYGLKVTKKTDKFVAHSTGIRSKVTLTKKFGFLSGPKHSTTSCRTFCNFLWFC